jgi:hypothetical protein
MPGGSAPGYKSLFAAFSSEKEDSSFFEKKQHKNFCSSAASLVAGVTETGAGFLHNAATARMVVLPYHGVD